LRRSDREKDLAEQIVEVPKPVLREMQAPCVLQTPKESGKDPANAKEESDATLRIVLIGGRDASECGM
jgi:hypothetical protein